ncbi:MAG: hypothetical protein U9Q68_03795 [Euryarchaeota archaeon]|nr:hypothetical protein [Euryarchaeota archaeon]
MLDLGYAPLRYYWLIEYADGRAIAQFDPETGEENLWKSVPKDDMIKASLAEFSTELSEKIIDGCGVHTIPSMMPYIYSIDLEPGDNLILFRRNYVSYSGTGVENRKTVFVLGKNDNVEYAL